MLFETDEQIIYFALSQWANSIETGNPAMSAQDAQSAGETFRALDVEQMKFVVRIRELAAKHLNGSQS